MDRFCYGNSLHLFFLLVGSQSIDHCLKPWVFCQRKEDGVFAESLCHTVPDQRFISWRKGSCHLFIFKPFIQKIEEFVPMQTQWINITDGQIRILREDIQRLFGIAERQPA